MTVRLLLAFAAVHALFAAVPALDLWIAARFFDGTGFPAEHHPLLDWLRRRLWNASALVFAACALLWAALGLRRTASDWRPFAWGTLTMLLGPGLLVNGILKAHWGRPRPDDVQAFGGEMTFTPPVQIAGECLRNCSFVSGEASGAAAAALIVLGLLAGPARWAAALALGLAAFAGALRVAMGGHWASDVAMAWILTALVARGLWRALGMDRAAAPHWRHLRADLALRAGSRASRRR